MHFFDKALKFQAEAFIVRPDDPGMPFDDIAFFAIGYRQQERLPDINAVNFIGFEKNATQTDIFYLTGVDFSLSRIFNIYRTWFSGVPARFYSSFDGPVQWISV